MQLYPLITELIQETKEYKATITTSYAADNEAIETDIKASILTWRKRAKPLEKTFDYLGDELITWVDMLKTKSADQVMLLKSFHLPWTHY